MTEVTTTWLNLADILNLLNYYPEDTDLKVRIPFKDSFLEWTKEEVASALKEGRYDSLRVNSNDLTLLFSPKYKLERMEFEIFLLPAEEG